MRLLILLFFLGLVIKVSAQNTPSKHVVEIRKMKFVPAELHIKKGDTVVWINRDFFPHDVAKSGGESWRSTQLEQGESWFRVFQDNEEYYCRLHVVMKGKIMVK